MIERRKQRKDIDFIEFARQHIVTTPNEGTKTVKQLESMLYAISLNIRMVTKN